MSEHEPRPRPHKRAVGGMAAVGLALAIVAGCSSGKSSSNTGSGATPDSGTSSAALGAPDEANGSPVTVTMISDGGSGAIGTAPLVEQGVKMAVAYANAYKGGIGGHRVNLAICEDNETPSGAQSCANQAVQQKAVVVLAPETGQGAAIVPIVTKAGIPYVTLSGASVPELIDPGSFVLTGGYPAVLGAFALQAKSKGYTSFDMLVSNVPAAIQGAQVFGAMVFKNVGIQFKVIPVAPGTADMTPQLESAVSSGAKAIGITGDVTLCSSFLKGYETLGLDIPKYVIATCEDPSIFSSLGSTLNGSYVATTSQANASDKALYAAIVDRFAPSVNPDPNSSANQALGYTAFLGFENAVSSMTGPVTASTVEKQMETARNVPIPLSGGITYTCNGTAIPLLKAVCSSTTDVGVTNGSGVISDVQSYNPTPLFH
jgi:branched-chain amino acid transport system substrate-binding protein